jgi:hypothetical protein
MLFGTDHQLFQAYSDESEQLPVRSAPHVMACDGSMDFETERYVP